MNHLMFTTQVRINVNTSDIEVYNTFVNDQADFSELTDDATWFAIPSTTSVDARENAFVEVPVYRIDVILLASDFADMWDGSLAERSRELPNQETQSDVCTQRKTDGPVRRS